MQAAQNDIITRIGPNTPCGQMLCQIVLAPERQGLVTRLPETQYRASRAGPAPGQPLETPP